SPSNPNNPMARLFPERLPESALQDPRRGAERRVYQALRALPDTYTVFYSVAWLSRIRGGAQDGEADFVIAHPEQGILVLEVKGGGIAYDATTGQWTSTDRQGIVHAIKDPADQARRSKHALLAKLQELPGWRDRWITLGHGVVFPDVDTSGMALRPDLPPAVVLDWRSLDDSTAAIQQVFAYWHGQEGQAAGPGTDGMRLLTQLLGRSFRLRTPLGVELAHEEERIVELTEEQMRILDVLGYQRRAAIQGCAGSGKTMLALEKARRLANEGFDVLLTCFNLALAQHLAQRVPEGVTVLNFHGLCEALIAEAGLRSLPPQDLRVYYDEFLPSMLLDAIDELGPQYDAIVVDEGQDFKEDWWIGLQGLLRDPEQGILYVFFDDNQNLYRGVNHIPGVIDSPPFPLRENCRNTQRIHQLVSRFHPQGDAIGCRGPTGRPPQWVPYSSHQELGDQVRRTLHRLVNEEGVAAQDVVILTPKAERRSVFKEGKRLGNFQITRKPFPQGATQIWTTTVHAFKGLERKVVLLAELDPWASRQLETLLYVGASRARTHLLIFHNHRLDPETLTEVEPESG
ncbi:MAG TPA: hypothetical protein ENJ31_07140, partial [Anaerolineae bacterium]|nr:hypothetical protein [Anaerolineae bacterium]